MSPAAFASAASAARRSYLEFISVGEQTMRYLIHLARGDKVKLGNGKATTQKTHDGGPLLTCPSERVAPLMQDAVTPVRASAHRICLRTMWTMGKKKAQKRKRITSSISTRHQLGDQRGGGKEKKKTPPKSHLTGLLAQLGDQWSA